MNWIYFIFLRGNRRTRLLFLSPPFASPLPQSFFPPFLKLPSRIIPDWSSDNGRVVLEEIKMTGSNGRDCCTLPSLRRGRQQRQQLGLSLVALHICTPHNTWQQDVPDGVGCWKVTPHQFQFLLLVTCTSIAVVASSSWMLHVPLVLPVATALSTSYGYGTNHAAENHHCAADRLLRLIDQARETKSAIPLFGVHDALSAKIMHTASTTTAGATTSSGMENDAVQHVRVPVPSPSSGLFISGFGVSASRLGVPDAGIISRPDILDTTQNILLATVNGDHPPGGAPPPPILMVDGDTGFGGTANVRRTIHSLAALGAAAVTIEDQIFPKRCTYVAGSSVQVVSRRQAQARIMAAVQASKESWEQRGQKLLIVGRTDCRNAENGGTQEALERCLLFQQAGADIVYAESLHSTQEYLWLRREINDPSLPMMIAQVQQEPVSDDALLSPQEDTTKPPGSWTIQDIGDMNYELALFGVTALQATVAALQTTARHVLHTGGIITTTTTNQDAFQNKSMEAETMSPQSPPPPALASLEEVKQVVGFPELDTFESEFGCS